MRLAVLIFAAVALAACQVEVEGARCDAPGATDQCPVGQACGTGGTCSKRAAACTPCVRNTIACRSGDRMRCDGGDPDCGAWVLEEDCGPLACNDQDQPATCECAHPGSDLYVDSTAGGTGSVGATGAASPPECRFPTIPDALAVATAGTTVHVVGEAGVYSALPIRLRRGVSLVADDVPPSPASRVLTNAVVEGAGVVLEEGARLAGFTVRAASGDPRTLGIHVECAAADKVTISAVHVDVEAGAALDSGIQLNGACDVDLENVEIRSVTGVGLKVALASPATVARMIGGQLQGCQTGAAVTAGDLRLEGTIVANNVATGVAAGDNEFDTRFSATDALFTGNGDTALVAFGNARLDLQNNRICVNRALTPRGPSPGREVGGIFIRGAPPAAADLVFSGNEIHHNFGDQVFVTGTNTTWTLDGGTAAAACSSTRNLFFGYDQDTGRGLVADARVNARWNAWGGVTPTPPPFGQDFEQLGAPLLDVGASSSPSAFCDFDPVPVARACP